MIREIIELIMSFATSKTRAIACSVSAQFCDICVVISNSLVMQDNSNITSKMVIDLMRRADYHTFARMGGNKLRAVQYVRNKYTRNITHTDAKLKSYFYYACKYENIDMINAILNNKDCASSRASKGLCAVVKNKNVDIFNLLINHTTKYCKAFNKACLIGNIYMVNRFIDIGVNCYDVGLKCACWGNQVEIARIMVKNGAVGNNNMIRQACNNDYYDIVKLLCENGVYQCHCLRTPQQHIDYCNSHLL
jgi:hypothetical protein